MSALDDLVAAAKAFLIECGDYRIGDHVDCNCRRCALKAALSALEKERTEPSDGGQGDTSEPLEDVLKATKTQGERDKYVQSKRRKPGHHIIDDRCCLCGQAVTELVPGECHRGFPEEFCVLREIAAHVRDAGIMHESECETYDGDACSCRLKGLSALYEKLDAIRDGAQGEVKP